MTTPILNAAQPVVIGNGTMSNHFRDWLLARAMELDRLSARLDQHEQQLNQHEQRLDDIDAWQDQAVQVFVGAAYGGINLISPSSLGTVGSGWTTVVGWDSVAVTNPRLVGQEFNSDGLRIEMEGIWSYNVVINMSHNESNQGRTMGFRFLNFDTGVPSPEFDIPIARNQPGTLISFPLLNEVSGSDVDDLFQLQISGGSDTFTSVSINNGQFSAVHNSPFVGAI